MTQGLTRRRTRWKCMSLFVTAACAVALTPVLAAPTLKELDPVPMVTVPGGLFLMGSESPKGRADEWPPRQGARQSASCEGSGRVGLSLAPEAGAPCVSDATPPTARSAGCRGAAHTGPHRWSRPRAVSACRQDTRVGGVRQSARASTLRPAASARTATARDPGACAGDAVDGPAPMPRCAPCKPDTDLAPRCGPTRGSRCRGPAPIPTPSSVANGHGPAPGLRFHVLRHSCVDRISVAWQHRSPSGPEVLHLELELKQRNKP